MRIRLSRPSLHFRASTTLAEGMSALVEWLQGQEAIDRVDIASEELSARGLAR